MKRTRHQAQETRNQILDAAEWVFAEHGVAHTSLEDVAVRAGFTRGAIYGHFRNKGELFVARRTVSCCRWRCWSRHQSMPRSQIRLAGYGNCWCFALARRW
ncbi:TetR family transcriptional regulator [Paraburkholderia fungorum]|uniref:TetR family transcriptional regulator n=1 Tax=Paraburkholderia fungorum TaxID=134537 RepID=UPI0038BBB9FE